MPSNLIALKQLQQAPLSGFILQVTSGVFESLRTTGIRTAVPTGVDEYYWNYGFTVTPPPSIYLTLQCPTGSQHLISPYLITGYNTGAYIVFSNTINSSGYFLHGLIDN